MLNQKLFELRKGGGEWNTDTHRFMETIKTEIRLQKASSTSLNFKINKPYANNNEAILPASIFPVHIHRLYEWHSKICVLHVFASVSEKAEFHVRPQQLLPFNLDLNSCFTAFINE